MALADTLPQYITDILSSKEYEDFIESLRVGYLLTDEQTAACEDVVFDLFRKKIVPENLLSVVSHRIGRDEVQNREIARTIMLNIVIAFHFFFGDHSRVYKELGGDIEQDAEASPILRALLRETTAVLEQYAKEVSRIDFEKEQNAMRELFAKHLTDHFYAPDGDYKIRLNDTILALLQRYDVYNEKLLGALYDNEEDIGMKKITLPDGTAQSPTVAHWLQDYLGFSGGDVSSITLAKYISQNKNVLQLHERDKDAARRLLETFVVLKNFPESLDSISEEQWKIIPYYHTNESMKVPYTANVQGATAPTITIVEAQESTAKAALPLKRNEPKIDLSFVSEAVIAKSGAIFSDDIRERVKKILETRVRNVRNDIDARERLTAAVAEGGAGIAVEEAEKVLAEAKKAQQAIADGKVDEYAPKKSAIEKRADNLELYSRLRGNDKDGRGNYKESRDDSAPKMMIKEVGGVPMLVEKSEKKENEKKKADVIPSVSEEFSELQQQRDPSAVPRDDVGSTRNDRAGSVPPAPPASPAPPVAVPTHLRDAKEIPVVVTTPKTGAGTDSEQMDSHLRGNDTEGKPSTSSGASKGRGAIQAIGAEKKPIPDVKAAPRLVTVIDELRALTIKDIRRISQDPKSACQKIADKINALAKESLSKRAEAINAWKENPAYALYLEIGQLNIGQDMAKFVEERKVAGKEYLTADEFDALLELNEKLRF